MSEYTGKREIINTISRGKWQNRRNNFTRPSHVHKVLHLLLPQAEYAAGNSQEN
ncbi:hypothetical protein J6590_080485 [Homalodisca vitripennis]|nr:hypothetical protein J6590_080485 [Homalodisca vitripennis]